MIGKVTRGSDTGGLLRYLYGPGRANEHRDPHLVASWLGDGRPVLDGLEPADGRRPRLLADRLDLPMALLPDRPQRHVWQCSMRLADGDRRLSDGEWAQVAREVVERTGFAPADDPGGCRWVAVRHAADHIHVVVTLARQDGGRVDAFRDWPKVHAAARAVEARFGLVTVESPDRSAVVAPTRGEQEKARRLGTGRAPRAWLAREVRVVAAGTTSREAFERELLRRGGVAVKWRFSTQTAGLITGYSIGRVGDTDQQGRQIWFSGSRLAADLSLPKLLARWAESAGVDTRCQNRRDEVFAAVNARLRLVGRGPVGDAAAVSVGETASVLADLVEGRDGGPMSEAADRLARAVRRPRGVRPVVAGVHDLRGAASGLYQLGRLTSGDARHVVVTVANLAQIAEVLGRRGGPQVGRRSSVREAGRRLRVWREPVGSMQIEQIRRALPPRWADEVLRDPALPALAAQLQQVSRQGLDPEALLRRAFQAREVGTAESVAAVLHHRLQRAAPVSARVRHHGSAVLRRPGSSGRSR